MNKIRLDQRVFDLGLAESREKAKAVIMSGAVYLNGQKADKPGMSVPADCVPELRGETLKYVSRGGLKLEKALRVFPVDVAGKTCIDCGASTGGFTDVLLQNGAAKVYAVDVGYGQLAWKLRQDPRVVCMEKTNIRYVTPTDIGCFLDFASCDVSFISLTKILVPVHELLKDGAHMVCLIKPQFEAGKERVGKKGVVRDPAVHEDVIEMVWKFSEENGYKVLGLDHSPIKGPEGNIEYLIYLEKCGADEAPGEEEKGDSGLIHEIVSRAHQTLD